MPHAGHFSNAPLLVTSFRQSLANFSWSPLAHSPPNYHCQLPHRSCALSSLRGSLQSSHLPPPWTLAPRFLNMDLSLSDSSAHSDSSIATPHENCYFTSHKTHRSTSHQGEGPSHLAYANPWRWRATNLLASRFEAPGMPHLHVRACPTPQHLCLCHATTAWQLPSPSPSPMPSKHEITRHTCPLASAWFFTPRYSCISLWPSLLPLMPMCTASPCHRAKAPPHVWPFEPPRHHHTSARTPCACPLMSLPEGASASTAWVEAAETGIIPQLASPSRSN